MPETVGAALAGKAFVVASHAFMFLSPREEKKPAHDERSAPIRWSHGLEAHVAVNLRFAPLGVREKPFRLA